MKPTRSANRGGTGTRGSPEAAATRGAAARHAKWVAGFALMALLLSDPRLAAEGAARAMAQCRETVAPALLPFFALLPLLTCREASRVYEQWLGRTMMWLFNLPGGAAPAMIVSMVAGMPAGAIAARNVAAHAGMNRGQLHRMTTAFSGFSPAFLIGGIGAGMLGRVDLGWRLLASQALTQMTLALLLRRAWRNRTRPVPPIPDRDSERPPFMAMLTICGYMALFGALTHVIGGYLGQSRAQMLLCLMDVPAGAGMIAALPMRETARMILLAAACGFGGMCVIVQCLSALKGCGVVIWQYLALRLVAAAVGAGYMALLTRLPGIRAGGWTAPIRNNPLATAALIASLSAIPVLAKLKESIFNKQNSGENGLQTGKPVRDTTYCGENGCFPQGEPGN